MASRTLYPSTPSAPQIKTVAPVNKGGTGGADVVSAAINLGAISQSSYGQPNGVAVGDSSGSVPSSSLPGSVTVGPTLNGPVQVYPNQQGSFEITNFDSLTTYVITTDIGSAILNGSNIVVTGPTTGGVINLTVNGKVFQIPVGTPKPAAPTLTVKLSGTGTSAQAAFTGSTFAMIGAGSATHASSDWELYSDAALTNLVTQSQADTTNKTSWTASGLSFSTTYYARCRYRDSNGNVSDWAQVLSFATAAGYYPGTEEAILVASDKGSAYSFGYTVAMSSDGSRVIVGSYSSQTNGSYAGAAYVFVRNGTTWTQEQKLIPTDGGAGAYYGNSVSITDDGTRILAAAYQKASGVGCAYVFVRNTSTNVWTQEAKIVATGGVAGDNFGWAVSISGDGTRCIVGAISATLSSQVCGNAYCFSRNITTNAWTQEAVLSPPPVDRTNGGTNLSYGCWVSLNYDGSRGVIGAYGALISSQPRGAAYCWSRSGTTWAIEQKITASDGVSGDNFGRSCAVNYDGSRIIVGSPGSTRGGINNCGVAYIFSRSGVIWTQDAILLASDKTNGDNFGTSVSLSADGSRAVIGATGVSHVPSGTNTAGATYVFSLVSSAWTQQSKLFASNLVASGYYGCAVSFAGDGTRFVVGSYRGTATGTTNAGTAYIES